MPDSQYVKQHLILLCISTISYLRYLFPIKCYDDVHFNGMALKRLNGNTLESRKLLQHIERGLFDALEKDFVKSISFYLYYNNTILESYTMNIVCTNRESAVNRESSTNQEKSIAHENPTNQENPTRDKISYDFATLLKDLTLYLQEYRGELCLEAGKVVNCLNPDYCSIKVTHSCDSTPLYIPPTFDFPTELKHYIEKEYKDEDFYLAYESLPITIDNQEIRLRCERAV